jgi:hypothetical protein
MEDHRIITSRKIQHLIRQIEKNPAIRLDRADARSSRSGYRAESGHLLSDKNGKLAVLCTIGPEVWFVQGGIVYAQTERDFAESLRQYHKDWKHRDPAGFPKLRRAEIEFILGVAAAAGPIACWTVFGTDTATYLFENCRRIEKWKAMIGAILLLRSITKMKAPQLYQELNAAFMQGVWSRLPQSNCTDDGSVARLAGFLAGHYGHGELLEREMELWWWAASPVVSEIQFTIRFVSSAMEAGIEVWQTRAEALMAMFGKSGIRLSREKAHWIIDEIKESPDELGETIRLVQSVFGG